MQQGALTYPLIASEMHPPGWPDRYVAHRLWSGFLEFKAFDGSYREDQLQIINDLRLRRVPVYGARFDISWMWIQFESPQLDGSVIVETEWCKYSQVLTTLCSLSSGNSPRNA